MLCKNCKENVPFERLARKMFLHIYLWCMLLEITGSTGYRSCSQSRNRGHDFAMLCLCHESCYLSS